MNTVMGVRRCFVVFGDIEMVVMYAGRGHFMFFRSVAVWIVGVLLSVSFGGLHESRLQYIRYVIVGVFVGVYTGRLVFNGNRQDAADEPAT